MCRPTRSSASRSRRALPGAELRALRFVRERLFAALCRPACTLAVEALCLLHAWMHAPAHSVLHGEACGLRARQTLDVVKRRVPQGVATAA